MEADIETMASKLVTGSTHVARMNSTKSVLSDQISHQPQNKTVAWIETQEVERTSSLDHRNPVKNGHNSTLGQKDLSQDSRITKVLLSNSSRIPAEAALKSTTPASVTAQSTTIMARSEALQEKIIEGSGKIPNFR